MDLNTIKDTIVNWIVNNGWNIVTAILVLVVGTFVIKIVMRILKKVFAKSKVEKAAQSFILSVLKYALWLILILAVISTLGISITGFVVVLSAASLAISLALESSLSNLVNGFLLVSTKLFKEGDYITVSGNEGTVRAIKMLYTVLRTEDSKTITIPNSKIMSSEVINYSAQKIRRLELKFDVSYSTDIDKAKAIVNEVLDSTPLVLANPEPLVVVSALGTSSVTILVRVCVMNDDYWTLNWYLLDHIFNEFKRNNINIPYNQLDVYVKKEQYPTYFRKEPLPEKQEHKTYEEKEEGLFDGFIPKEFHLKKKNKDNNKKNNKKNKKETSEIKKESAEIVKTENTAVTKSEEVEIETEVVEIDHTKKDNK